MPLKTIKIFIASSSELEADRNEFRNFIGVENDRLNRQGIYLKIVQWEHFQDSISETRLQDEYNKAIRECDIMLCLFFTKVGKYTAEEFDTAYQVFRETKKPLIWTYFKNAPTNEEIINEEILIFRKKIADLGHFPTNYNNIDNLKYQFRNQLDIFLSTIIESTFNEILTRRLIEAIQAYSPRAKRFLENATVTATTNWETQPRFSDPAKEIIAFSYVGILGIQLRKLMAIGKEDLSENKQRKYLGNCQLTAKRALQLLCFALISKLWDYKKERPYILSPAQTVTFTNFFDDEFELDINGYLKLLNNLVDAYADNKLDFPIPELNDFNPSLQTGSEFVVACAKLQSVGRLLDKSSFTVNDCTEAETQLTTVLTALNFLANYKMVSIKSIGYYETRNSKPHYLYNYTALGIDSKSNINQERINYAESPINTDAVLLYKGSYQENLNLFPFIIDVNALAFEGGAKICFYASHNYTDNSLNYNFLEDDSIVNITNTETLKPGIDINELLLDPKKRKEMRFDSVFTLFKEAKKTITGIEENNDFEDPF